MNGKPDGVCTVEYLDGDRYVGLLAMGRRNGFGRYEWMDGNSYEGEWKFDKRHGAGLFMTKLPVSDFDKQRAREQA